MINSKELEVLKGYHFIGPDIGGYRQNRLENDSLLAIKRTGSFFSKKELIAVRRVDVTTWEIFKSHFGFGKLAGCDLHITSIAKHLENHSFNSLPPENPIYQTVHAVASKVLHLASVKKEAKIPRLWSMLANNRDVFKIQNTTFYFCPNTGKQSRSDVHSSMEVLMMTPLSTVGHLAAQINILKGKDGYPANGFELAQKISDKKDLPGLQFDTYDHREDWLIRRHTYTLSDQFSSWSGKRLDSLWNGTLLHKS